MNQVRMEIIIDTIKKISEDLYNEKIDGVDASFLLDKLIDELEEDKKYLPSGL